MNRHPVISHIRQLPARELPTGALIHDLARRLGHLLARGRHVRDGSRDAHHLRAAVGPEDGHGVGDAGLRAEGGQCVDADYCVGDLVGQVSQSVSRERLGAGLWVLVWKRDGCGMRRSGVRKGMVGDGRT